MSEQMKVCPNCGAPVGEQAFCQACGAAVNAVPANTYEPQPAAPVYEQPAAPVYEQPAAPVYEQPAAPVYEQPVAPAYQQSAYGQQPAYQQPVYGQAYNPADVYTPAQPDQGSSKKKVWIILGAVAGGLLTLILLIVLIAGGSGPNFKDLYREHCESTWASYGSDYLKIDTNPYDWDDDGLAYYEAWEAVQDINEDLGLPDWLVEDMLGTSASDGVRSESFKDQGVTVTWTYHPDEGLEVTYKEY